MQKKNTHTKIHTRRNTHARAAALRGLEARMVIALFCAALCSVGVYIYFVSATIVHAVVAKDTQHEIVNAHSRIAELEAAYLAHKDALTPEHAAELGFQAIAAKHFVERTRYLGRADARAAQ